MRFNRRTSKASLLLPLVILLLAAGLRLYQLPTLPPGLNFDEAGNGVAALDILRGEPHLWWRIGGGKEPLWPYVIALSTAILGNIPLSLRFPAAIVGTLTVAAVYPLMLALFRGQPAAKSIALFTMLGLALSDWHLHFSRLGFRAILLPLLSTLALYFFWKSFVTHHASRITHPSSSPTHHPLFTIHYSLFTILSAFFTALAIYAYLAGRLLPFVPLLFIGFHWLITKIQRRPTSSPPHLPISNLQSPISTYLLFLTLFLLPLIIYFLLNPADFTARAGAVSIFNPDWNNGDLLGTVWQTLRLTLGTFLGLTGDPNPLVNLPHQPAAPFFLAPFFILGLLISLYYSLHLRLSSPNPPISQSPISNLPISPSPYRLLLCWWLLMLLPAILAPEGAPHHLRLLGTIVPTYAFLAIGLTTATAWLNKFLAYALRNTHYAMRLAYLLPATCYLLLFTQTTSAYFTRWPTASDFTLPFDLYAVRLAADIAAAPPDVGYVLPMDIRAGREARHYTLDYLLADEPAAYTYILVDERNAETGLRQATVDKTEVRVVRWTQDKHLEADAKEIVTYLLETNMARRGEETFPVYNVETYEFAENSRVNFDLPAIDRPIGATFDGLVRLDAAYVQPGAAPGEWLPVALTFAPLAPMEADYKASLRLIGPTGERLLQKDRTLWHNFHQGTSLWPPETVNEYYLLPVPPDAPPGDYTVVVVIYHPDTLAPLVAEGVVEAPVGQTRIE